MKILFAGDLSFDWLPSPSPLKLMSRLMTKTGVPREVVRTLDTDAGLGFVTSAMTRARVLVQSEQIFKGIREVRKSCDHFCVNLECALSAQGMSLDQKRFTMRALPHYVLALRTMGVTVACLANNHVLDYGPDGFADTVRYLELAGVQHCGLGMGSPRIQHPTIVSSESERIAILNYVDPHIIDPSPDLFFSHDPCPCPFSPDSILESVVKTSAQMPVVVVLHWGEEWSYLESDAQRQFAHAIIDAGASAVISHHSHLAGTVEEYKGRPISFGLGNLFLQLPPFSTQRAAFRYLLRLQFSGQKFGGYEIIPIAPDSEGFPSSRVSFALKSLFASYLPDAAPKVEALQFDSFDALENAKVTAEKRTEKYQMEWSNGYYNDRTVIEGKVPIGPGWCSDQLPWTGLARHRDLIGLEFSMMILAHTYDDVLMQCSFNLSQPLSRLFVIAGQPKWFQTRPGFVCPRLKISIGDNVLFEYGPENVSADWLVQELPIEAQAMTPAELAITVEGSKGKHGYLNWRLIGV